MEIWKYVLILFEISWSTLNEEKKKAALEKEQRLREKAEQKKREEDQRKGRGYLISFIT